MIRIGVRKSMHEEVQKYSLEDIVAKMVQDETNKLKATDSLKRDIENKQKQANNTFTIVGLLLPWKVS